MKKLVRELVNSGYLKTAVVIDAFSKVNRRDFVLESMESEAEVDAPLPIGFGQTISQPLTVAFMLELLEPKKDDKILDIGSGSGWTASLLAHIVDANGKVIALERIAELKKIGEKNADKYGFVKNKIAEFYQADGAKGFLEKAPYDKILVSAAAEEIPKTLKEQLKIGGRLVIPLKNSIILVEKKAENKFKEKEFFGFSFVPLITSNK